jgi:uncharacterized membrane protein
MQGAAMMGGEGYAILFLALTVIFVIMVIVWIFLPFIILGTNRRLDRLITEQQTTNALLDNRLPDLRRK